MESLDLYLQRDHVQSGDRVGLGRNHDRMISSSAFNNSNGKSVFYVAVFFATTESLP